MVDTAPLPSRDFVLGQKHAYATSALIIGVASFISMFSLEKAALAITFGALALRDRPGPRLSRRRALARTGVVLGAAALVGISTLAALAPDRLVGWINVPPNFP